MEARARACDVVLDLAANEAGGRAATPDFESSVRGAWIQRGSRLAIAFAARDAALPDVPVRIRGDVSAAVAEVRCFDDRGRALVRERAGEIASISEM
jgi:hypothetical protein